MSLDQIRANYLTVQEIAAIVGRPVYRVHYWINLGHLPCEKILNSVAVLRTDFEKFQNDHPELIEGKSAKVPAKN